MTSYHSFREHRKNLDGNSYFIANFQPVDNYLVSSIVEQFSYNLYVVWGIEDKGNFYNKHGSTIVRRAPSKPSILKPMLQCVYEKSLLIWQGASPLFQNSLEYDFICSFKAAIIVSVESKPSWAIFQNHTDLTKGEIIDRSYALGQLFCGVSLYTKLMASEPVNCTQLSREKK